MAMDPSPGARRRPTTMAATAVTLTFSPGGHLDLPISNVNPNLIVVPGDRVTNISSAAGLLTDKKTPRQARRCSPPPATSRSPSMSKPGWARCFLSMPPREPPRGAVTACFPPSRHPARSPRCGKPPSPTNPCWLRSIAHCCAAHCQKVTAPPASTKKPLHSRRVTGHARFRMGWQRIAHCALPPDQPLSVPVVLREPDFWMPGTRAIMVHPRYQRLIAGASTWLYVIRTQEHTDGQH